MQAPSLFITASGFKEHRGRCQRTPPVTSFRGAKAHPFLRWRRCCHPTCPRPAPTFLPLTPPTPRRPHTRWKPKLLAQTALPANLLDTENTSRLRMGGASPGPGEWGELVAPPPGGEGSHTLSPGRGPPRGPGAGAGRTGAAFWSGSGHRDGLGTSMDQEPLVSPQCQGDGPPPCLTRASKAQPGGTC